MDHHLRALILHSFIQKINCTIIFFHPDCTVGPGISPDHASRLAGFTAGRESHPALKISIFFCIIILYCLFVKNFLTFENYFAKILKFRFIFHCIYC